MLSRIILGALVALIVTGSAQAQQEKLPFPFNIFQLQAQPPVAENDEAEAPRPRREVTLKPRTLHAAPKQCDVPNPADYGNDTIIVSTCQLILYHIDQNGEKYTYRIGGGRDGFRWAGKGYVGMMKEWPDWHPPKSMIERERREKGIVLPARMEGGIPNPLGARALYIFDEKTKAVTEYRIHGTNNPDSIGKWMSSGCIRLLNAQVMKLYDKVRVGTKVVVLN